MGQIINDVYVIYNSAVIFSRKSGETIDEMIFGAYINAINQFSSELTEGGVREFELLGMRFVLLRFEDLLFVASAPTRTKSKKIQKVLSSVSNYFLTDFPVEFFKGWDGNTEIFNTFHYRLNEFFM